MGLNNGLDVRIMDVAVGSGTSFGSTFGVSHPRTILKEIHEILRNMPEEFTLEDVAKYKCYDRTESAFRMLKRMRRMQMIKRVSSESPIHIIAPMYKNRIL